MKNLLLTAGVLSLLCVGCVEQKMTITSEPTGAIVYVSDVEVGRTPVTVPFTWPADYDIVIRKEGCQTLVTHANLKPAAYEIPPMDLFAELWPQKIEDHRYLHFVLDKLVVPSDQDLIKRAQQMRQENIEPVKQ